MNPRLSKSRPTRYMAAKKRAHALAFAPIRVQADPLRFQWMIYRGDSSNDAKAFNGRSPQRAPIRWRGTTTCSADSTPCGMVEFIVYKGGAEVKFCTAVLSEGDWKVIATSYRIVSYSRYMSERKRYAGKKVQKITMNSSSCVVICDE